MNKREILPTNQKLLFLFSLPRSGSTLLQRILAAHNEITTTSEPWILLPYLYTLKKDGVYANYNHIELFKAVKDFCLELPHGQDDYVQEINGFVKRLYAKVNKKNARYFLDKTPRYHLIAEEIIRTFPGEKFIFLWRNPFAIIASMMDTWGKGKWNIPVYDVDLYTGLNNLIEAYKNNKDAVFPIRYEDILRNPDDELKKLFNYLDVPFYPELLHHFNKIQLKGRLGDPKGIKQYHSISRVPLEKWKHTMGNPVRKMWCRRYLNTIGHKNILAIGYHPDMLLSELKSSPFSLRFIISDMLLIALDRIHNVISVTERFIIKLKYKFFLGNNPWEKDTVS